MDETKVYTGNIIIFRRDFNTPNSKYYTNRYIHKLNALLFKKDNGIYVDIESNKRYNSYSNEVNKEVGVPLVDTSSLVKVRKEPHISIQKNRNPILAKLKPTYDLSRDELIRKYKK